MIWRLFKRSTAVEPLGSRWAVYEERNYRHVARKARKFGIGTALDFLIFPVLLKRPSRGHDWEYVQGDFTA
jgi:hypothetical protein